MTRKTYFCCLVFALAGLAGCSSKPSAKTSIQKPAPDKIQGKAQILLDESSSADTALNAGGPSVYLLVDDLHRYRLFFNKPFEVQPGAEYMVEGVYAQKAIDAIGDPDQGKNGYPLLASCASVVGMAWPGLAMDLTDSYSNSLRAKVNRFPARPVFLVTAIEPAKLEKKDTAAQKKEAPEVSIPAEKQRALLVEGPTVLTAPLWEPAGGTVHCKVLIDEEGKISELHSGSQLCESVPWSQFRYKPTPKRVNTEVEIRFDRK
jgi:hypothetical protein